MRTKKSMAVSTVFELLIVAAVLLFIILGPAKLFGETADNEFELLQNAKSQEGPGSTIPKDVPLTYSKVITTKPGISVNNDYFGRLQSTARTVSITSIVLHHTGGSTASGAIDALRQNGYSVHYMVDKDGTIYYLVDESREAFHTGCCPPNQPTCCKEKESCILCVDNDPLANNHNSIGIEIVNTGKPSDYYTEQQYTALKSLLEDITSRHRIPYNNDYVFAHYQITKGKPDPSSNFDWTKVGLEKPDLPAGQTNP